MTARQDNLQPVSTEDNPASVDPEALVRSNINWMLALAEHLLRDRGLAEDVVQEAFMRALRGLPGFEGRSSLKSWLRRITVNTALSKLRQVKRLAEQPIDEHLPEFDRYDCRVEVPWTRLASVDEIMESDDLRDQVYRCMDELGDAYRVVLHLRISKATTRRKWPTCWRFRLPT